MKSKIEYRNATYYFRNILSPIGFPGLSAFPDPLYSEND
jgi:hypothetical protein